MKTSLSRVTDGYGRGSHTGAREVSGYKMLWDLVRITFRQYLKKSEIAWEAFAEGRLEKLVTFELHKDNK